MKDPFYHNEKLRYDSPIPSREFIIELLKKNKKPINFETLTKRLNLTTEKHICAVKKRIKAMIREQKGLSSYYTTNGLMSWDCSI